MRQPRRKQNGNLTVRQTQLGVNYILLIAIFYIKDTILPGWKELLHRYTPLSFFPVVQK
jgi:hypothetical protein